MWIKICGITSLEDAETAIAAGADALGFVFAESPRRVTPEAVREIVDRLSRPVETIGVFVEAASDAIAETYRTAHLTGVQLHGTHGVRCQDLRPRIGATSRVLEVVRYDGDDARFAERLQKFPDDIENDRHGVLVDSCVAGKQGGTGIAFDWSAARAVFLREAPHLRLIAAGGLTPKNVHAAIRTLEPWGVDVSSGVEASPGKKDPYRVAAFIRTAREAWAEVEMVAR